MPNTYPPASSLHKTGWAITYEYARLAGVGAGYGGQANSLNHTVVSPSRLLAKEAHYAALLAGGLWTVSAIFTPVNAQVGTTVLPTDITPTTANLERTRPDNGLQLRLWQRLPSSFFFNTSVETSLRVESNPFQYPLKRTLLKHTFLPGQDTSQLTPSDIGSINQQLGHVGATDNIYRINPNVTAGWALTPNTQVFANYFMLRDSVFNSSSLNSTTKTIGFGAQSTYNIGKASIQPQILVRELYQTAEPQVLDYLPAMTLQYQFTPNLVAYLNTLLQVRMLHFVGDPQRELNPFYTTGAVYQRGRWQFSASGTFLQNVRKPFGKNSILPINNDSFVLDFEVDRQPFTSIPGLQAFIRAEPVYNFASHATPGLAGMDFRLYYGLRMTVGKPPLNGTVQQLMQRYKQPATPATVVPMSSLNQISNPLTEKIRNDIAQQ